MTIQQLHERFIRSGQVIQVRAGRYVGIIPTQ